MQRWYNERKERMAEVRAILKILTFFKPGECPFCLNDGSTHSPMCLTTRASDFLARTETVDDL